MLHLVIVTWLGVILIPKVLLLPFICSKHQFKLFLYFLLSKIISCLRATLQRLPPCLQNPTLQWNAVEA